MIVNPSAGDMTAYSVNICDNDNNNKNNNNYNNNNTDNYNNGNNNNNRYVMAPHEKVPW